MCGRYFLSKNFKELINRYGITEEDSSKNNIDDVNLGEIFPSQKAPVVISGGTKKIVAMNWGFSPSFAKKLIINARGETVENKPTFKDSFYKRRCLIPAEAFFEWEKNKNNKKIKRQIKPEGLDVFSMAGIFDKFFDENNMAFYAFTILTIEASQEIKSIHSRMPVILDKREEELWLKKESVSKLKELITPYSKKLLIA